MAEDVYQERYLAHQKRKAEVLKTILAERHSERQFGKGDINVHPILDAMRDGASSCDRRGVNMRVIVDRDDKNFLGGILVGGVGWVHRAHSIIMLFADLEAYKAPGEADFMPYLDAGVMVGHGYLAATANDMAVCFVNPNVRDKHRPAFEGIFGKDLFCGALALGGRVDT